MSYPQYPPQQQPQYPPQQQPQYPPQQPGYASPQAPQYYPPQQPGYPPAQAPQYYPPQQAPQYPPQQQPQYAPPPPPVAAGDISDFYDQPAASGKSISFNGKPPGTTYTGMVARTITKADVQVQTDMVTKQLSKHPDGRLKYTMVIPLLLQPSAEFPDGRAAWYCKHNEKPELERAMEAAGVKPGTPPEQGAMITITYTGDRPVPGMSPQKMKTVTYARPQGANGQQPAAANPQPAVLAEPTPQQYAPQWGENGNQLATPATIAQGGAAQYQQGPPAQPQFQAPQQQYAEGQYAPVPQMPQQQQQQYAEGQYAQAGPPAQAPFFQPPAQPQPVPQAMPQQVASLSDAQQKLLAQLTGDQPQ